MAVSPRHTTHLSIIVPTRDRCESLTALLGSLEAMAGIRELQPEIIIGDNDSPDRTWEMLQGRVDRFPTLLRPIKVLRRGKSAVLNDAIGLASGDLCAFLDDDVVVEPGWLEAVHRYFEETGYSVAQGVIRLPLPESHDPEILRLLERFRTISANERPLGVTTVGSLDAANMVICRSVFDRVGGFDERLGPGVSGTSEDTELAQRILDANIEIGYMKEAIVFHRVERERLTEAYFQHHHRLQGRSRFVYKEPGLARILAGLVRALASFVLHSLTGNERRKYRGKGRIYHYQEMLGIKLRRMIGKNDSALS